MPDQVTQDQATFAQWAATVEQLGGVATAWPFQSGLYARYYGQPAARFDATTYANLANAGRIDMTAPQQANVSNGYVYVLADGVVQQAAQSLDQPTQQEIQAGATAWLASHTGLSAFANIGTYALYAVVGLGALVVLTRGRR